MTPNPYERTRCEAFHKAMINLHNSMVGRVGIRMDMNKWTDTEKRAKVSLALEFASFMHLGQMDKSGIAYIEHPVRVSECVNTTAERIVALLHDTIEDTNLELKDLAYHYPKEIIDAIDAITKRKGEQYKDYIQRVAVNHIARRVKIADLKDNMSAKRWCFGERDLSNSMWKRYSEALLYLERVGK